MANTTTRRQLYAIAPTLFLSQATAQDCIPIDALLGQGVFEVNLNVTNINGYNTTGALEIWSDNPLRAQSLDGEVIGKNSGKCTLLPGAEHFFCYGMMKISENDTITYTGLSPNNLETGKLAITGGSGCYEEAKGTLFMTAQGEDYGSYLYGYEAGASSDTCVSIDQLFGDGLKEANIANEIVGDFETPGSKDLWAGNPFTNSDNEQVGKSYGDCTLLPGALTFMCIGVWLLNSDDGDIITFGGYSPNNVNDKGMFAVTGGTDCYAGKSATLSLVPADANYTAYDWNYETPPSADDCKTLVETLGGNLIFEDTSGSELIGDYETASSLDYWYGNELHSGSHDGPLIAGASSLGECMLLTNAAEFMCLGQHIIDDKSTFVSTGFSPNSFEAGTLSISGGTGCFEGIKGEITLTAQSIEKDFDFFSHEIKSTNEVMLITNNETVNQTDDGTQPSFSPSVKYWPTSKPSAVPTSNDGATDVGTGNQTDDGTQPSLSPSVKYWPTSKPSTVPTSNDGTDDGTDDGSGDNGLADSSGDCAFRASFATFLIFVVVFFV